MDQTTRDALLKTVSRMPDWIRHDLAVKDASLRIRAEESLVAMLVDVMARAADAKD